MPLNTPSTVQVAPRQRPIRPQVARGGDLCVLRGGWGGLGLVPGHISASRTAPSPQKACDREAASQVSGPGQPSVVIRTPGPRAACLASASALKCTSRHHLLKDDKPPWAGVNDGDGDQLSIIPGHRCPSPVLDPASSWCHGCSVTKGTEGGTFLRKQSSLSCRASPMPLSPVISQEGPRGCAAGPPPRASELVLAGCPRSPPGQCHLWGSRAPLWGLLLLQVESHVPRPVLGQLWARHSHTLAGLCAAGPRPGHGGGRGGLRRSRAATGQHPLHRRRLCVPVACQRLDTGKRCGWGRPASVSAEVLTHGDLGQGVVIP